MSSFKEKITYWGLPLSVVILFLILIQLAINTNPIAPVSDFRNDENQAVKINQMNHATTTAEDDQSILQRAVSNQEISLCSHIHDKILKNQCHDQLNYSQILQTKNLNDCIKLYDRELKEKCYNSIYFFLATKEGDKKLCEEISDSPLQSECLNRIEILLVTQDSANCNIAQGDAAKKICLDKLELTAAINESNLQGCQLIEDLLIKDNCQKTVIHNQQVIQTAEINNRNIPDTNQEKLIACNQLAPAPAGECKDKINFDLAFEELDLNAYCNKISTPQKRQECFTKQGDKIDKFYFNKAISTADQSTCEMVSNIALRQLCADTIKNQI